MWGTVYPRMVLNGYDRAQGKGWGSVSSAAKSLQHPLQCVRGHFSSNLYVPNLWPCGLVVRDCNDLIGTPLMLWEGMCTCVDVHVRPLPFDSLPPCKQLSVYKIPHVTHFSAYVSTYACVCVLRITSTHQIAHPSVFLLGCF